MSNLGPDPNVLAPMLPRYRGTVFLKALARGRRNVTVGDYSYYDDANETRDFFDRNVLYHYEFTGDQLHIGRFCALAYGVQIVMNGGSHTTDGFSTFPFNIFESGWQKGFDPDSWQAVNKGDTVIGSDVWIGREARLMPGITIGHGAIIAAFSVVTKTVAPFTIVAGNPARPVKARFPGETVDRLLELAWWDWPVEKISRNLNAIRGNDILALEAAE